MNGTHFQIDTHIHMSAFLQQASRDRDTPPTVHAVKSLFRKISVINNCGGREHVEAKSEVLPQLDTVAPFALVVKAIHAVDRLTLVVASQQEKAVWVFHLVREHEADSFNTLLSSVHIVSYEQEFMASSGIAGNFKESEQVEVLSMNISKNFDRRLNV